MAAKREAPKRKPLSDAEKAARKTALANETKADKFRRLAMKRMPKALKALGSVANLSSYEFTEAQRDKVLAAIGDAANEVRNRFMREKKQAQSFDI